MPRFEYRLDDANQANPLLYYYDAMSEVEAAMRYVCDYFVKDGETWLKTRSAIEPGQFVLFVEKVEEDAAEAGNAAQPPTQSGIAVEVREYREGASSYPLLHQFAFDSLVKALPYLVADTMMLLGQSWEKTSTEIDEDRQAYVYYCSKAKG